jgi:hypothetical protein
MTSHVRAPKVAIRTDATIVSRTVIGRPRTPTPIVKPALAHKLAAAATERKSKPKIGRPKVPRGGR